MQLTWCRDLTRSQMLALYVGEIHYGTWQAKWAKFIHSKLSSYRFVGPKESESPHPEIVEQLRCIEEELGWAEALRLLARRSRFSAEIEQHLQDKGCSLLSRLAILDKCRKSGYIDDEARVLRLIEIWKRKGYGPLRIQLELQKHGIQAPLSTKQIGEEGLSQESLFLIRYIEKKLPKQPTHEQKVKVIRALLRRGFTTDSIYAAMAQKKNM